MSKSERRKTKQLRRQVHKQTAASLASPVKPLQNLIIQQTGFSVSASSSYSGPIPPPAMLKEFNDIIPDRANRILTLTENQQKHRHAPEIAIVNSDILRSWAGLFFAGVIVIAAIFTGGLVAWQGQPWAGAMIAAGPSAAVVGVFIY